MKKIVITIAGLTLLFFSSNSLACNCDDLCNGCWPTSEWCKCATECNKSDDCVKSGDNYGEGCIVPWTGIVYLDFATCVKDSQPFDMIYFGPGTNCAVAVCKIWMQYFDWREYDNLGECIKDQASLYGQPWPGAHGDFEEECGYPNSETWVEGCECIKDVIFGNGE